MPAAAAGGKSRHELYLMCYDIGTAVEELQAKGVESPGTSATKDSVS
jgi:hypothetical protein